MGVTAGARLDDTRHAFDGVAPEYDRSNTENPILRAMRQRTVDALTAHVPAGARLLDLGCGPGTDAEALGRAGFRVTAIDWSPQMVAEASRRVLASGLQRYVDVHRLGIHQIDRLERGAYDGAYSNFGPLNCVPSLSEAARLTAGRLRPGGVLVASVIGRVCPWELAVYLSRGQWARARVRFARAFVPVPLDGGTVWTRYYAPDEFLRVFEDAGFVRVDQRALGLFVPPPYMQAFAARHPGLIATLQRLDDRLGRRPILRSWGDHFLMVLRRGPLVGP